MSAEKERLQDPEWKNWGPYVSNRAWGTVREDYSSDGNAWSSTNYFDAIRRAFRWNEDGIAGICGPKQRLCFALSFWNGQDKILKERFFGVSNHQGNHGEDLKEIYYYLDSTPTHSYMKMLYKYPTVKFPYEELLAENLARGKNQPEFEISDTGIFQKNSYFDILIEYAKATPTDFLIRISVTNRSDAEAEFHLLPTLWYRNNWSWGHGDYIPELSDGGEGTILITHEEIKVKKLISRVKTIPTLFCNNETNLGTSTAENSPQKFYKDGINNHIIYGSDTINPEKTGTKACLHFSEKIPAGETRVFDLMLLTTDDENPFDEFDEIFRQRKAEADEFYSKIQHENLSDDQRNVQRQAFAGLLWNKQFYHYNVSKWIKGDPKNPVDRNSGHHVRNSEWQHMQNKDIISMPDKWEYPWFATWDLAFHCVPLALIDAGFAKHQLKLLTKEWYLHPNGQLPAYEWDFSDVNPPVHAWSTFRVYKIDEKQEGKPDIAFLESVFQKLLLNFTWWVNRKDKNENNIFGGGFLGLDNIGAFDRNMKFRNGVHLEQADGTSWMAMYALNMMRISMELALYNPVYEDMAIKFFEHFLYIAQAMEHIGENEGLWDEEDGFFYDVLQLEDGSSKSLKLRSIVGLIPMFAVEIIEHEVLEKLQGFRTRMDWILKNKPELTNLVSHWEVEGKGRKHLMSILRKTRLTRLLQRMLDEKEFLSDYGIRSMSKCYEENPFVFEIDDEVYTVSYLPAESDSSMFGGNSNWRGPIWFPINFLIVESLQRYHYYYGESLQLEFPLGSGEMRNLGYIADNLSTRLQSIFLKNKEGERPANGENLMLNYDPNFKDYLFFHEYFDGDTGKGLGASHQCGWTATVAKLMHTH